MFTFLLTLASPPEGATGTPQQRTTMPVPWRRRRGGGDCLCAPARFPRAPAPHPPATVFMARAASSTVYVTVAVILLVICMAVAPSAFRTGLARVPFMTAPSHINAYVKQKPNQTTMPSEVTQIWNDARKGLEKAVQTFWQTRDSQGRKSRDRAGGNQGSRHGRPANGRFRRDYEEESQPA